MLAKGCIRKYLEAPTDKAFMEVGNHDTNVLTLRVACQQVAHHGHAARSMVLSHGLATQMPSTDCHSATLKTQNPADSRSLADAHTSAVCNTVSHRLVCEAVQRGAWYVHSQRNLPAASAPMISMQCDIHMASVIPATLSLRILRILSGKGGSIKQLRTS